MMTLWKPTLGSLILLSIPMALLGDTDPAAPIPGPKTKLERESLDEQNPRWNFHAQNTDIFQYHPPFGALYSGPNSLSSQSEDKETVSIDLMTDVRLWRGSEFCVDGLTWQGFGLSKTLGINGFPNGEAFRVGTDAPNFNFSRVFLRQTIGLGGGQEEVEDADFHLAGKRDVRRLTFTLGKINVKDLFDNNSYANDPRTQFMNWSLMANGAWDFPADSLGYIPGFAVELNQTDWALRYGFFQAPKVSNGLAKDYNVATAWGQVIELERRWTWDDHPGAIRFLSFFNHARMGSFNAALDNGAVPADITQTRNYRLKYGFGLNDEQEVVKNVGIFSRLGWNDGKTEPWAFMDADWTGSWGVSVKGEPWGRKEDTFGLAYAINGITSQHQRFLAAGGTGILVGDGNISYGWEKIIETYYDFQIYKALHGAFDFQYVDNPAFNRDRGPVPVISGRIHWEY